MNIGDRVRDRREALGMNQEDLARAVRARGGSLSQAQVSQLEAGVVKRPRALPELIEILQTTSEWLLHGTGDPTASTGNKNDIPPANALRSIVAAPTPLVLFRALPSDDRAGETMVYQERAGDISRPVELTFSKEAFAFKVVDDEAEPNYERRDTLLIDPSSTPAPGDHCFLVRDPEQKPYHGAVRRLVRITPEHWVTRKFIPGAPEVNLDRDEWRAAWPIFGKYNRR